MPTGYIMESCPEPWKCQEEKGKAREKKKTGSGEKREKKRKGERKGEDVRICPLEDAKNFQRYREITESDFWERLLGNIYGFLNSAFMYFSLVFLPV